MLGDALTARLGARFLFVTIVPNMYFVGVFGVLFAAGAPAARPSWTVLTRSIDGFSFKQLALLTAVVIVVSLVTHPLQLPLIQIVEGYWLTLPGGEALEQLGRRRYGRLLRHLRAVSQDALTREHRRAEAQRRMRWLPDDPTYLRPTELGNVLFAGEVRAGGRYSLGTDVAWPRLRPLLPERIRSQVNDTRNQMDASVRFCIMSLLAAALSIPMLIRYDVWLTVPLGLYLFAWGSYRAAVAAAKRFCQELAVAFDLYHLQLWDALSLERPRHLGEERERAPTLSELLAGEELTDDAYAAFAYAARRDEQVTQDAE